MPKPLNLPPSGPDDGGHIVEEPMAEVPSRRCLPYVLASIMSAWLFAGGAVAAERTREPGEGVVCVFGIYSNIYEYAHRCVAGDAPELQAELKRSVDRLSDYVAKNQPATPDQIAQFKATQGGAAVPTERLCASADVKGMYSRLREHGAAQLRASVDKATARPGKPTWGSCL